MIYARFLFLILICLAFPFAQACVLGSGPKEDKNKKSRGVVRVFILAGQSNMEGHAKIQTFDYIGDDPKTAHLLKAMRSEDGKPTICNNAWISYLTGRGDENGEGYGRLTAGYGSRTQPTESSGKIGPEFTFGITMDRAYDDPVLIIKTAWGGKSLFYDYRSPSSGTYPRTQNDIEKDRRIESGSGHYYRLMTSHVQNVLNDINRIIPEYDPTLGYKIEGFVWFQGFNDMVNREVYPTLPKGESEERFAKYSSLLTNFIRDVRQDLDAPSMPFIIGVMGVGGRDANEGNLAFRKAMAKPAMIPEFHGNVVAIPTSPFWDEPLAEIQKKYDKVRQMGYLLRTENKNAANADGSMTKEQQKQYLKTYERDLVSEAEVKLRERGASNAGYHYLGCAKTFAMMGEAFANAILQMQQN